VLIWAADRRALELALGDAVPPGLLAAPDLDDAGGRLLDQASQPAGNQAAPKA
jgi:hypothetical protein